MEHVPFKFPEPRPLGYAPPIDLVEQSAFDVSNSDGSKSPLPDLNTTFLLRVDCSDHVPELKAELLGKGWDVFTFETGDKKPVVVFRHPEDRLFDLQEWLRLVMARSGQPIIRTDINFNYSCGQGN